MWANGEGVKRAGCGKVWESHGAAIISGACGGSTLPAYLPTWKISDQPSSIAPLPPHADFPLLTWTGSRAGSLPSSQVSILVLSLVELVNGWNIHTQGVH